MLRNGIGGSYVCSIFFFLRNLHTDFHMVVIICNPASSDLRDPRFQHGPLFLNPVNILG